MGNVYVRYSSSCSSSRERLCSEFTFHQESAKRSLEQLFRATVKLITDEKEITGVPVIDWQQLIWQKTTLLSDKAVQCATAKLVFSDSVL